MARSICDFETFLLYRVVYLHFKQLYEPIDGFYIELFSLFFTDRFPVL